jgi:hypothetical protein
VPSASQASRRRRRQLLRHEAALGADRHDDRVLDLLRLDQAEHLGAEILRPVRPAQAAARDLAEAQMHALDPRRIDEDLVERRGAGMPSTLAEANLNAIVLRGWPSSPIWKKLVRRPLDQVDEAAQDAVLVEAGTSASAALDALALGGGLLRRGFLSASARIELGDGRA